MPGVVPIVSPAIVGVPREVAAGETRVALTPAAAERLVRAGVDVRIEAGAGRAAGHGDEDYAAKGATVVAARSEVFADADVILQVRTASAQLSLGQEEAQAYRKGQVVIGLADPLGASPGLRATADSGATLFALELIPRTTRAQSMDVLSSMAMIAGYKAVLLAATASPRLMPMMMTAAGTLQPARVLVIGAGVAGLSAIGTARRLGAIVSAYDVRPAVKEQVESLGASFVELALDAQSAEGDNGYAKDQGEDFYRRQRELMASVVAKSDVVITTAAIPGQKAPVLVTRDMVGQMRPGSVIVDLAAASGGNCELSRVGTTLDCGGVTILAPADIVTSVANHASQLYAQNLATFTLSLLRDGALAIDHDDDIVGATCIARAGVITHPRVQAALEAQRPISDERPSTQERLAANQ